MFLLKSFYRYYIRGTYQYQKAIKALKGNDVPIVIYTMAKVGSMSLYNSIKKYTKVPVFHIHTMQREKIEEAYQLCRNKGWWPDSKNPGALIYDSKIKTGQPIKIITAIREPIARNVSAFFEVFRFYNGQDATTFSGGTDQLQKVFTEALPHRFPLVWLEEELQICTGIDVYAQSFNPDLKFQIYQNQHIELLLLRVDLPNEKKETIIRDFLKLPDFKLSNYNVGSEKDYADLYQSFKKQIQLPASYLNEMLESKYCKHFYTEQERKEFYAKWKR